MEVSVVLNVNWKDENYKQFSEKLFKIKSKIICYIILEFVEFSWMSQYVVK